MKWIRPSGTEVETNNREETIEYCKSLGWKPAKKKPGRKPKEKKDEAE